MAREKDPCDFERGFTVGAQTADVWATKTARPASVSIAGLICPYLHLHLWQRHQWKGSEIVVDCAQLMTVILVQYVRKNRRPTYPQVTPERTARWHLLTEGYYRGVAVHKLLLLQREMDVWEFNGTKTLTTYDTGKLCYGQILEYTKKTEQGCMNDLYIEGILWHCHAFGGTLLVWSGSNCPVTNPLTILGTSLVAVTVPSSTWLHIRLGRFRNGLHAWLILFHFSCGHQAFVVKSFCYSSVLSMFLCALLTLNLHRMFYSESWLDLLCHSAVWLLFCLVLVGAAWHEFGPLPSKLN